MSSEFPWVRGGGAAEPLPHARQLPSLDASETEGKKKSRRRREKHHEGKQDENLPERTSSSTNKAQETDDTSNLDHEHKADEDKGRRRGRHRQEGKAANMPKDEHEQTAAKDTEISADEASRVKEEEGKQASAREQGDTKAGAQASAEAVGGSRSRGRNAERGHAESFTLPHVSPEDLMNEQDVSIPVLGGKEEDSAMQGKTDVYVEATGTGVFRRKKQHRDDSKSFLLSQGRHGRDKNLETCLDLIAALIASSFIFCQGILGGIGIIHFYLIVHTDQRSFLRSFSPIADDTQRAFLFLSSVALVGALDKFSKDQMAGWMLRGRYQFWLDMFLIASYTICFITNLVCTPLDDVLTRFALSWTWSWSHVAAAHSCDLPSGTSGL
uniref:Transmembrane protein n=2 Tax=Guillardia theta TaxID=55529 RepID=A0A6U5VPB5_GUITH|mmetsp:Transcript_10553/g.35279  ORF Transcript_10553/g.35279 Transcript_10553/m.35279 type:complete len:383 (+) Transcript_10553:261-1409(+)